MITKFRIHEGAAESEFGMACQRIIPWQTREGQEGQQSQEEPPIGGMACFLPAGASSDPDCHDQDEVMVILSGSGSLDLAGEKAEFTVGDVLVLARNKEHVVHNPTAQTLTWLSVYWPLHEPRQNEGTEVSA
ncbi:cupin domain-containing protein [Streptomyces broussonetiae]|uniref:Cupin domain-containing protein n=1 Tax=Streptomyces broussonetiae TaxID=2686304 RepID=A0A6I6NG67_9ACTN|nr:cupin domain-containing protein [Streptomyces broussonetiae]QHA06967.1 cupin domain-containing protein [Streptomyces broussonetiae]